jgi:fatty acid desaturase
LVVVLAFWGAIASGHWAAYLAAIIVIATRQQALGVMLHDAVHYLLYKNRTLNDVVSDLFIAFPLAMSTDLYRATHFRHHRFTNTEDDPDLRHQRKDHDWFDWPKTRAGCAWVLVKSLFGLNIHKAHEAYKTWSPWVNILRPLDGKPHYPLRARILLVISTIAFYAVIVGLGIIIPAIVLWAAPLITIMNLLSDAGHRGTHRRPLDARAELDPHDHSQLAGANDHRSNACELSPGAPPLPVGAWAESPQAARTLDAGRGIPQPGASHPFLRRPVSRADDAAGLAGQTFLSAITCSARPPSSDICRAPRQRP